MIICKRTVVGLLLITFLFSSRKEDADEMEAFKCPHCGAPLNAVDLKGNLIKCGFCGSTQRIDLYSNNIIDEQPHLAADSVHSIKADEERNYDRLYNTAIELANKGDWYSTKQAINLFSSITDWRDSSHQMEKCQNKLSKELEQKQAQDLANKVAERRNNIGKAIYLLSFVLIPVIIALFFWLTMKGCRVQ